MHHLLLAALLAAPAAPATPSPVDTPERTVDVTGIAEIETPPDVATLRFVVTGEGRTADEASSMLAARHRAVTAGLAGLLGARTAITATDVAVQEARGAQCQQYGPVRMSQGECAVTGYVATISGSVRTTAVEKVGTAAGLALRLGARDAQLSGQALADPAAARARAMAAALADARARASAIASGMGARLGPVLRVRDTIGGEEPEIVVAAVRVPPPPPPPAPPPPVTIDFKPRPVTTRAQVYVTFALED